MRNPRNRRIVRLAIRSLAVGVVAAALLGVVFVIGMRTKSPVVQRAVRRMNKAYWNPRSMATAGRPGAYASVVDHVGRRSGTSFETPIVPVTTEDGFVIALPYGARADWVQNVLAAGEATITHEGERYEVDHPEVVPTDLVDVYFSESDQKAHRAFRVDECLRVRRVDLGAGPSTGSAADEPTISASRE
jgi:deazaflavin-dependent oxidoreductase (nitroreductase family)